MKHILPLACAALLLALPVAARADANSRMDLLRQINKLQDDQLDLVAKFKANAKQASDDQKAYNRLKAEDVAEKKEHLIIQQQRGEVNARCQGVVPEGTLIMAENECASYREPFQKNVDIHNKKVSKTHQDFIDTDDKEKKRTAELALRHLGIKRSADVAIVPF